jgi:hypothetical protein
LTIHDSRIYTLERRVAMKQTMFGTEATDAQLSALRKAIEHLDA